MSFCFVKRDVKSTISDSGEEKRNKDSSEWVYRHALKKKE
jgi:hypothetical protein